MARRYLVTPLPGPGIHALPPKVAHHAATVNRTREGEPIVLFDGAGREAVGHVVGRRGKAVDVEILELRASDREPDVALTVAFAAPRAHRAERIFEQGCEIGIRRFVPLITERARPGADSGKRRERWQRIVEAASGQCDRAFVPIVDAPTSLDDFLTRGDLPEARVFAAIGGEELRAATSPAVVLAVGPEGGFAAAECAAFERAGFVPAALGRLTLRTETAVLVGAARLLQ